MLAPLTTPAQTLETGVEYVIKNQCSGKALSVLNNSATPGAAIVIRADAGIPSQRWKLLSLPDGSINLIAQHNQMVADANNKETANGTPYILWPQNSGANQRFRALVNIDDTYKLVAQHAISRVLDVRYAGTADDTPLHLWDDNGSCAQRWTFVKSGASSLPPDGDLQDGYLWKPLAVGGGGFIMSIDISPDGNERVLRTDTYGAYRWENNRWKQLVTAKSMPPEDVAVSENGISVVEIVFAPSDSKRLYMQYKGRIYRSNDRGDTWKRTTFSPVVMDSNDDWRQQGPRLGVDPVNPDVVYAGTQQNGLFVSLNGGTSWAGVAAIPRGQDVKPERSSTKGPGVKVWFDPTSAIVNGMKQGIVVNSYGNGFWKSNDAGTTWQPISSPGNGAVKVDHGVIASDGTYYMASYSDSKVWRYRGGTWQDISVPGGCCFPTIAADPFKPDSIWVFAGNGRAWRSTNAGGNWTSVPLNFTAAGDIPWLAGKGAVNNFVLGQVRFDTKTPGLIWVSSGTGMWKANVSDTASVINWQAETRGIEQLVANDVIAPPGQRPVLGGWDFGTRGAEDADAFATTWGPSERFNSSWQLDWSTSNPAFIVTNFSDHRFCCSEDGKAVLGSWSADGGRSWTPFAVTPVPPGRDPKDPWAFGFGSIAVAANDVNNIIWLPTFNLPPYYTLDRGKTWNIITLPEQDPKAPGSHYALSLNRKVIAADRVLANTFYYAHSGGENGIGRGLWRTTDGGANWARLYAEEITPYSIFNATLKAVPGVAGNLFFTPGPLDGVDGPFRRSINGGETWQDVAGLTRVYSFGFGKAALGASYPAIYVAGKLKGQNGIYRSIDNALSWTRIARYPTQSLDQVRAIDGDKNVFGRVYIGLSGSGWVYGAPQR